METDLASQLVALVQVIFIDLVLAGDNAIVVGMAAASVPLEQPRRVIIWGTAAAVVLRIRHCGTSTTVFPAGFCCLPSTVRSEAVKKTDL